MTDDKAGPKYPLSWRQKRTPTRQQKRSRRWRRLIVGQRIRDDGTWVLREGPWRKIRKTGSVSWVTVECSTEYGGCGREFARKLHNIIQGSSTGCVHCHQRRLRARQQAETEAGTDIEADTASAERQGKGE